MQEAPAAPPRPSWLDLIAYITVGFGLPAVIGGIVLLITDGTIPPTAFTALIILLNLLSLGGTAWVLGALRHRFSLAEIGFIPPRWEWRWLIWATGITILLLPVRVALGYLAQMLVEGNMESLAVRQEMLLPEGATWVSFLVSLFGIGLLAPVSEELFFRGALYQWFRGRYGIVTAVISTSLLFAIGHADSAGVVVASLIIGIVNAIVVERTRSLWAAIAIHAFNNSLAVLMVFGASWLVS